MTMTEDYEGENNISGAGYSGSEARGCVELWGRTWRVCVIHAPV